VKALLNKQNEYVKKNHNRKIQQQARLESLFARQIIMAREKNLITVPEENLKETVDKLARQRQNRRNM
jgi:hypothetical protein